MDYVRKLTLSWTVDDSPTVSRRKLARTPELDIVTESPVAHSLVPLLPPISSEPTNANAILNEIISNPNKQLAKSQDDNFHDDGWDFGPISAPASPASDFDLIPSPSPPLPQDQQDPSALKNMNNVNESEEFMGILATGTGDKGKETEGELDLGSGQGTSRQDNDDWLLFL